MKCIMAYEIQSFSVTIPASTPISANFTQALAMPARIVRQIDITIPPGPRGEVGFALGASGYAVLPIQEGQFIVADNDVIHWVLENQIDSGAWEFFGYNTGSFAHTLYIHFRVDPPSVAQAAPIFQPLTF